MAKKEKATIDIAGFDVKLADGKKSKANKPDQLTIDSPITEIDNPNFVATKTASATNPKKIKVAVVDECIKIGQQIENLEAEQAIYEGLIIDTALTSKDAEADDDNFVKTVNVTGTSLKMQVQFRDAYSKMDVAMEAPLKSVFGDKFPIMFEKIEICTLRDGKLAELKTLLGDKFDSFFDTDTSIKPTSNFQQTFFSLRKTFKPEQKEVVEKVKTATQSKPAVKYPK